MIRRRLTALGLGVRCAFAGRDGWTRAVLTAVGVGLGVALLLVAASAPAMLSDRSQRGQARAAPWSQDVPASDRSVLLRDASDDYRGEPIYGWLVKPDGTHPVTPPGVTALPGPGEAVVSPALARLLASPEGALLRPRLPYRIVGTIGDAGLLGPAELAYYAGDDALVAGQDAQRFDRFGDTGDGERLAPILVVLVIIGLVVLLIPVAVFIAAAVRSGADARDRRLAALRLAGADQPTAAWISAGETLAGAVPGVLLGGVLLAAFRAVVPHVEIMQISVFGADIRPQPALAALIAVVVPVLAVVVTLLSLRRVSVEPLGVVRRGGGVRRRLWWRLLLPALGLALMVPSVHALRIRFGDEGTYRLAAGATLLLVGITALLPWLVEAVVRRLRGGGVGWQLATRRLQLDSGTAARLVSGIAVAVAGGIALQTLFTGVAGQFRHDTGQDTGEFQVQAVLDATPADARALPRVPGVRGSLVFAVSAASSADSSGDGTGLIVADCATLARLASVDGCADGDVFIVSGPQPDSASRGMAPGWLPAPGTRVRLGDDPDPARDTLTWTVPATAGRATALTLPDGSAHTGVFATPGAVPAAALTEARTMAYLTIDLADPDTLERVRDAAFAVDRRSHVMQLQETREDRRFVDVRRALFIGMVAVLLLIGSSLLVSMVEQLVERRRLMAMLVAVGTRRATLGASLLWQAAIPVLLGLALAVVTGGVLGGVLLAMVHRPVEFAWGQIGEIIGVAVAVVILVTGLSLPVLHRLMSAAGLRTE